MLAKQLGVILIFVNIFFMNIALASPITLKDSYEKRDLKQGGSVKNSNKGKGSSDYSAEIEAKIKWLDANMDFEAYGNCRLNQSKSYCDGKLMDYIKGVVLPKD